MLCCSQGINKFPLSRAAALCSKRKQRALQLIAHDQNTAVPEVGSLLLSVVADRRRLTDTNGKLRGAVGIQRRRKQVHNERSGCGTHFLGKHHAHERALASVELSQTNSIARSPTTLSLSASAIMAISQRVR
ncbi:hypothetical protein KRP22_013516 [Phytophthora ramorum]|nr:hypothetical protein KRP22_11314 [Phytophthora ramorum]